MNVTKLDEPLNLETTKPTKIKVIWHKTAYLQNNGRPLNFDTVT